MDSQPQTLTDPVDEPLRRSGLSAISYLISQINFDKFVRIVYFCEYENFRCDKYRMNCAPLIFYGIIS